MLSLWLLLLFGCLAVEEKEELEPCTDSCESTRSFWETCYADFQEIHSLDMHCYSDIDALGEALAAAGSDASARSEVYEPVLRADPDQFGDRATPLLADETEGSLHNVMARHQRFRIGNIQPTLL